MHKPANFLSASFYFFRAHQCAGPIEGFEGKFSYLSLAFGRSGRADKNIAEVPHSGLAIVAAAASH